VIGYEASIAHGGNVAVAYETYARGRVEALTEVCLSPDSTVEQIRAAQAAVSEMRQLIGLRETLRQQLESQE
jgi:hypothetical protein